MSRFISFSQKIMRQTKDLIGKGKKRFARKASDERGALMLEAIALLGLMTLMSPMLVKQTSEKTQEVEEVTIAGQMKMLRDAAMSYIDANLASLGDTSAAGAFGAGYTGADGEKQSIVLNNRDLAAFLPPGFCLEEGGDCVFQNRLVENYRAAVVRQHSCDTREASGQRTEECRPFDYTVLIVSGPRASGGAAPEIADRRAMRIAAMIGADGGFIPSANVAAVSGNASQISVLGSQGIWEIENVQDFFSANSGWTPGRGQVAVTTVYKGNATLGEFLYRKPTAVEGGNSMFTDLDMAGSQGLPNDDDGIVTDPTQAGNPHDIKGIKGLFVDSDGGLYVRDLARNTTLPGDDNFISYNSATQAAMMPRAQFTRRTMSTGDYQETAIGDVEREHRIRHNLNDAGMVEEGTTSIIHKNKGRWTEDGRIITGNVSANLYVQTPGSINNNPLWASRMTEENVGLVFDSAIDNNTANTNREASLEVLSSANYSVQYPDMSSGGFSSSNFNQRPVFNAQLLSQNSSIDVATGLRMESRPGYYRQSLSGSSTLLGYTNNGAIYGSIDLETSTNSFYAAGLHIRPYSLERGEYARPDFSLNYARTMITHDQPSLSLERSFNVSEDSQKKTGLEMFASNFSGFDTVRLFSENRYSNDVFKGGLEIDATPITMGNSAHAVNGVTNSTRFQLGVEHMTMSSTTGGNISSHYSGLFGIASNSAPLSQGTDYTRDITTRGQIGAGFFATNSDGLGRYAISKNRDEYRVSAANSWLSNAYMEDRFAGVQYSMNERKYQAFSENSTSKYFMPQRAGLESYSFSQNASSNERSHDSEAFINTLTGVFSTYGEQVVDWSTFDSPSTQGGDRTAMYNIGKWATLNSAMVVGNSYRPLSRIAMGTKDFIGMVNSDVRTKDTNRNGFGRYMSTSLNMEPILYGNSAVKFHAPSVRLGAAIKGNVGSFNDSVSTELKMYAYNSNPKSSLFVSKRYNETSNTPYVGNSFGGRGYSYNVDAQAKGGLETSIIEYNQTMLEDMYGETPYQRYALTLNSLANMREVRTRLTASYSEDDLKHYETSPYFDANGEVMPESLNSEKYNQNRGLAANSGWNAGEAQLDLSNFTNIIKDAGGAFPILPYRSIWHVDDNDHPALAPFAPQATLSAVSSDVDLLDRLNTAMSSSDYFSYGGYYDEDYQSLTKAAQLKLRSMSFRKLPSMGNSSYSHIPSARLDAVMARETDNYGRTITEGSSLIMDAYSSSNASAHLPQLQSTLTTGRKHYEQWGDQFRNVDDWTVGKLTTSDLWSGPDQWYREEKASLNLLAGSASTNTMPQAGFDLTSFAVGQYWDYYYDGEHNKASLNSYTDMTGVKGSFYGSFGNLYTGGMGFEAKNTGDVLAGVYALPSTGNISTAITSENGAGFFANVNSSNRTFTSLTGVTSDTTNKAVYSYDESLSLVSDNYKTYGPRSKITGGLSVSAYGSVSSVAEITATSHADLGTRFGRLILAKGSEAGIDLDARFWKIRNGYIEVAGPGVSTSNPMLAPYMLAINSSVNSAGAVTFTASTSSAGIGIAAGTFAGQIRTLSSGGTGYQASSGSWDGAGAKQTTTSMFKKDGSYKNIYNKFRLDPAYVSVMNDIKLTSRGGANLSDILPNYVLKSIYTLTNQYAKGPWPCQTTAENGNIISIAANGWRTQYNRDDANPGNCSFVIPRGRLLSAKKVPDTMTSYISTPGYLPIWENDCSFMNRFGDRNYCLTKTTKYTNDGTPRSMYVSYAANNYKKCKDTYNPSQCLTHPYMGSVAAPGMTMQVDGEYFDDRESGMCPAGYLPVMTVTPTAFDVGKVIFIDAGSTGETKYGAGVYGKFTDNTLKYVPYNVYGAQWNNWDNYAAPASDTDYINSDTNFVESHRFVNFGHQDYTEEVPSIYQPATRIAVAAKPLCSTSPAECKETNFDEEALRTMVCSSSNPTLCGWAIAMGTVTPNKVKTNPDTSPDYFWNMGGIFQNTMQAIVHTYCYFNPQNFYFPNMGYDEESGALRPLDNPNL